MKKILLLLIFLLLSFSSISYAGIEDWADSSVCLWLKSSGGGNATPLAEAKKRGITCVDGKAINNSQKVNTITEEKRLAEEAAKKSFEEWYANFLANKAAEKAIEEELAEAEAARIAEEKLVIAEEKLVIAEEEGLAEEKRIDEEKLMKMKEVDADWVLMLENYNKTNWDYYINKNSILQEFDSGPPSYVYYQTLLSDLASGIYSVKAECETLQMLVLELSYFPNSTGTGEAIKTEDSTTNPENTLFVWKEPDDAERILVKAACGKGKLGPKGQENQYIDTGDLWLLGLLLEYAGKCDSSAIYEAQTYLHKWGLSHEEFAQKPSAIAGFNQGATMGCFQKKELLESRGFL